MAQSSSPLSTAQETAFSNALCRSWFGVRETTEIDVQKNVTLCLVHTKHDTLDFIVKFHKAPSNLVSCPPDTLSDVSDNVQCLADAINFLVEETFGVAPGLVFTNVTAHEAVLAYKATLNLTELPSTQNAPE